MTTKTYTNRGNCARAARTALGKTAKLGTDFEVTGGGKVFTWKALKARKRAAREPGSKPSVLNQPFIIKLLTYIQAADDKGRTVADCAAKMGTEMHTVRGALSRARRDGAPVSTGRRFRNVYYTLPASYAVAA